MTSMAMIEISCDKDAMRVQEIQPRPKKIRLNWTNGDLSIKGVSLLFYDGLESFHIKGEVEQELLQALIKHLAASVGMGKSLDALSCKDSSTVLSQLTTLRLKVFHGLRCLFLNLRVLHGGSNSCVIGSHLSRAFKLSTNLEFVELQDVEPTAQNSILVCNAVTKRGSGRLVGKYPDSKLLWILGKRVERLQQLEEDDKSVVEIAPIQNTFTHGQVVQPLGLRDVPLPFFRTYVKLHRVTFAFPLDSSCEYLERMSR